MLGLPSALARYIDGFSGRSGIRVDLTISNDIGRLRQNVETTVFRIVQECLNNIHRHSGSTNATIQLERVPGGVHLIVRDEGRGTPPGSRPGVGITSMHERVNELGGHLHIRSGAGGTEITATIPDQEEGT